MKICTALLIVASMLVSDARARTIRVATYNLNWGNHRGDQVLDAIATARPDILCLQETTVQSEGFLRKHLSDRFPILLTGFAAHRQPSKVSEVFVFGRELRTGDAAVGGAGGGTRATTATVAHQRPQL